MPKHIKPQPEPTNLKDGALTLLGERLLNERARVADDHFLSGGAHTSDYEPKVSKMSFAWNEIKNHSDYYIARTALLIIALVGIFAPVYLIRNAAITYTKAEYTYPLIMLRENAFKAGRQYQFNLDDQAFKNWLQQQQARQASVTTSTQ